MSDSLIDFGLVIYVQVLNTSNHDSESLVSFFILINVKLFIVNTKFLILNGNILTKVDLQNSNVLYSTEFGSRKKYIMPGYS